MGKEDNLNVRGFTLGGYSRDGPDEKQIDPQSTASLLNDSAMVLKVLRGKQIVIEWSKIVDPVTMAGERTKIVVDIDGIVKARLSTGTLLTIDMNNAPWTYTGNQPWDFDKCQRGRCQWLAPGTGPAELQYAAESSRVLTVELGNTEVKIRRKLALILGINADSGTSTRPSRPTPTRTRPTPQSWSKVGVKRGLDHISSDEAYSADENSRGSSPHLGAHAGYASSVSSEDYDTHDFHHQSRSRHNSFNAHERNFSSDCSYIHSQDHELDESRGSFSKPRTTSIMAASGWTGQSYSSPRLSVKRESEQTSAVEALDEGDLERVRMLLLFRMRPVESSEIDMLN